MALIRAIKNSIFLLSKFWQKLREKTLRATVLLNVFTVSITYLE